MAVAVAEAGAGQEAATLLNRVCVNRSRDRDASFAGRTHARKALPQLGFAAYITLHTEIPRGLPSRTD
jgi:hypothetical protein